MTPVASPYNDSPATVLTRIYSAKVGETVVRFYFPPTGAPVSPWVAYSDVQQLAGPDDDLARFYVRNARIFVRFGIDGTDRVTVIPHWLAVDMIRRADEVHRSDFSASFAAESRIALNRMSRREAQ